MSSSTGTRCPSAAWVLRSQMADGGFVFILGRPFQYGHPQLHGEADTGAMFPTWFRTLSLALAGTTLLEHPLGEIPWRFVRCPGVPFRGRQGQVRTMEGQRRCGP